jgi:hypothetical protein
MYILYYDCQIYDLGMRVSLWKCEARRREYIDW